MSMNYDIRDPLIIDKISDDNNDLHIKILYEDKLSLS